jgi:hypothetical protein
MTGVQRRDRTTTLHLLLGEEEGSTLAARLQRRGQDPRSGRAVARDRRVEPLGLAGHCRASQRRSRLASGSARPSPPVGSGCDRSVRHGFACGRQTRPPDRTARLPDRSDGRYAVQRSSRPAAGSRNPTAPAAPPSAERHPRPASETSARERDTPFACCQRIQSPSRTAGSGRERRRSPPCRSCRRGCRGLLRSYWQTRPRCGLRPTRRMLLYVRAFSQLMKRRARAGTGVDSAGARLEGEQPAQPCTFRWRQWIVTEFDT